MAQFAQVLLSDNDPSGDGRVMVRVSSDQNWLEIRPVGYGHCEMADGYGAPVFMELYQGRLRLLVNADIQRSDPTHVIDLEGAQERRRSEQQISSIEH
jgi:hypothetical protein